MSEEKTRIHTRITPDTERKIEAAMPLANCRSQNEFVENALRFYCDYLISGDCTTVLPPIYLSALKATVQMTEDRLSRLLFKQAVELDMMMNVLAAAVEIDPAELREQRGRSIQSVKKTGGSIRFEDVVDKSYSNM